MRSPQKGLSCRAEEKGLQIGADVSFGLETRKWWQDEVMQMDPLLLLPSPPAPGDRAALTEGPLGFQVTLEQPRDSPAGKVALIQPRAAFKT